MRVTVEDIIIRSPDDPKCLSSFEIEKNGSCISFSYQQATIIASTLLNLVKNAEMSTPKEFKHLL